MFKTDNQGRVYKKKVDAIQRRCHRCHGSGRSTCRSCGGQGRIPQSRNVFGEPNYARCTACYGNRQTKCATCGGTGFVD